MTFRANDGPGGGNPIADILQSEATFDIIDHSATTFEVEGAAASGFEGWRLVLSAVNGDFSYQDGLPSGDATLDLYDPQGRLALAVTDDHYFWEIFDWATSGFLSYPYSLIEGSAGGDEIQALDGYDSTVRSGSGDDTVVGGSAYHELLDGGAGDDVLESSTGSSGSTLLGGAGDDLVTAGGAYNQAFGGAGDDTLTAIYYSTTLDGGAGNDHLIGSDEFGGYFRVGQGRDLVEGGQSYDTIFVSAPTGDHYLRTVVDGGAGDGSIIFDAATPHADIYADVSAKGAVFALKGINSIRLGDGGGSVHVGDGQGYDVRGGAGGDCLYGGDASDTLSGGGVGADRIFGGAGGDYLTAGDRGAVHGGAGDDNIILISNGRLVLDGGDGVDQLGLLFGYAFEGQVTIDLNLTGWQQTGVGETRIVRIEGLTGGNEADHFIGDDGANRLWGGIGSDTLDGGGGDDSVSATGSDARLIGGEGDDSLSLHIYEQASGEPALLAGGSGDDLLTAAGSGLDAILRGGSGSDLLVYQADSYYSALDFHAGDGAGTILDGSSTVGFEGIERFEITGSGAADTIVGGAGGDILSGQSGDDVLDGGDGDDYLRPGRGNDTIRGGAGFDTVDFGVAYSDLVWDLRSSDAQQVVPGEFVTLRSVEGLVGSYYHDSLTGDDRSNMLAGAGGDDSLIGIGGADTLSGASGADVLTGGVGADVFRFDVAEAGYGDVVSDLEDGDIIDLTQVDADYALEGDQAFALVSAFTGAAGELQLRELSALNQTLVEGDIDGDGVADLRIRLFGSHAGFDNFVL
jgi:Ca2+-binding RTX toxin-like protein